MTKGQKFREIIGSKGEEITNWILESQAIVLII